MAVDASHVGCFAHGSRLFVVSSHTGYTVAETVASFVDAAEIYRRRRPRLLHWSTVLGGAAGGLFLDLSAWHSSGLTDLLDLAMMFGLGGAVGLASAIGMRQALLRGRPAEVVSRLPAIEVPTEVARRAPDDATPDELALWSVLTRRFRIASIVIENLPFAQDPTRAQSRATGGTLTPAPAGALAELAYVTARHDFEPVAELLGLRLP